MEPTPFATKRMGGGCAQVGRPGIKEPGAPEGAPRTAPMTGNSRHKKVLTVERDAVRLDYPGYQTRSLIGSDRRSVGTVSQGRNGRKAGEV